MTRINTNVSSLTAQQSLAKSNDQLQTALTRLSTGLRINSGKDDPAGLIASEMLKSDIVSTQKAISNTKRANQMITTADSAIGQISSLLNDIRGLVTEAANKGAMSPDQIAANQLQVDSSLDSINRIAQTTSFQGRKLLDGSLGFVKSDVTGMGTVSDLQITQANLNQALDCRGDNRRNNAKVAEVDNNSINPGGAVAATAIATIHGGADDAQTFTLTANATHTGSAYNGIVVTFSKLCYNDRGHR